MTLADWGWTEGREPEFAPYRDGGWRPGRIVRPGRGIHRLASVDDGGRGFEIDARLTGRAIGRGEAPAAGDWVAWREEGGTALIEAVLHRTTRISRKVAGEAAEEQVMAANVDVLFVVQALGSGRGFTPRGLERYVAMAWESGCRPAVVLNKSDLAEDPEADLLDAEAAAPGVDVRLCSAAAGTGLDEVRALLAPRETGAFVGPSGAGKSSIINAVAGRRLAEAGEVRESDSRGRHTTTRRELHRLEDGCLLLDTPGLRELQLWGEADSADAAFPEIEAFAADCRFRDCRHDSEPGCAVRGALESGDIDPERFESWLELRRELAWLETRRDEKARRDYMDRWMKIARFSRELKKGKEIW